MNQPDPRLSTESTSVFPGGLVHGDALLEGSDHPSEALAGVEGLADGTALLVVKRGPNAGSRYLLGADVVTAGRHPDSDIFLDDVSVSRRHAEFRRVDGGFEVVDVGSLNGTYVNRENIDSSVLSGGDEVQIGKFRLVYLTGQQRDGDAARAPEVRSAP